MFKNVLGPSDFIDPAEKAEKEIKDIEEILPEIRNKVRSIVLKLLFSQVRWFPYMIGC